MCERFGDEVLLDHVQGRLSPEVALEVEQHFAGCAFCRKAAGQLQALSELSRTAPLEPRAPVDQAVRAAISAAAEERRPRRATSRISLPVVRRFRLLRLLPGRGSDPLIVAAAVAAAVFILVTLLAVVIPGAPPPAAVKERKGPAETLVRTPEPERPRAREEERLRTEARVVELEKKLQAAREEVDRAEAAKTLELKRKAEEEFGKLAAEFRATQERLRQLKIHDADPEGEAPKPQAESARTTATAPLAWLDRVEGDVRLSGTAARSGAEVMAGQSVAVGPRSRALLVYSDGTRVELGPDTGVRELGARSGADGVGRWIDLREGTLGAEVAKQPAGQALAVATPHGEARVLGTTLRILVNPDPNQGMRLEVTEGRVRLTRAGDGKAVTVGAGHYAVAAVGVEFIPRRITELRARRAVYFPAAGRNAEFQAPMTPGRFYAEGSLSGTPVYSPSPTYTVNGRVTGGWVAYAIDVPFDGEWYLWGRFYYPGGSRVARHSDGTDNDPNSFWVSVDGGDEAHFGNLRHDDQKRSYFQRWHWGGDGTAETGLPVPVALGYLPKGRHTLRVRERESYEAGDARLAPRLDMLCLTPDRDYHPRDEDVRR